MFSEIVDMKQIDNNTEEQILDVWERSVRETHDFLNHEDIKRIRFQVKAGIYQLDRLFCVRDENEVIKAFIGLQHIQIEMLFIHPLYRGRGLGRKLITYTVEKYNANHVDVNEQNVQGVEFYQHLGFKVYGRSPSDENGNPFPILHMRLEG